MSKETDDTRQKADGGSLKQTDKPWKGPPEKEQKPSDHTPDIEKWQETHTHQREAKIGGKQAGRRQGAGAVKKSFGIKRHRYARNSKGVCGEVGTNFVKESYETS
jgi:hypothetical protein